MHSENSDLPTMLKGSQFRILAAVAHDLDTRNAAKSTVKSPAKSTVNSPAKFTAALTNVQTNLDESFAGTEQPVGAATPSGFTDANSSTPEQPVGDATPSRFTDANSSSDPRFSDVNCSLFAA